jgi:hypothetical protein
MDVILLFSLKCVVVSIIAFKPLKFNILFMNIVSFWLFYVGKNNKSVPLQVFILYEYNL